MIVEKESFNCLLLCSEKVAKELWNNKEDDIWNEV